MPSLESTSPATPTAQDATSNSQQNGSDKNPVSGDAEVSESISTLSLNHSEGQSNGGNQVPKNDKGKSAVVDHPPSASSPYTNLSRHPITDDMVFAPIPNRDYHESFMRQAIGMAEMALASDETPVGCVFVRDGQVIGRGINGTNASLNVGEARRTCNLI